MTAPVRKLSSDFIVYGVGEFVIKAFSLVTLPMYTRVFTTDQFGILSYVVTLGGLLGALLVLGGDTAYARYFFEARTLEHRQLITSTWIGFLAAWSALICLLILPFSFAIAQFSFGNADSVPLLIAVLLAGPVTLVNLMCAQVLRNQFRAWTYTILNVASTIILVTIIVACVLWLRMGLLGVLGGTLIAQLLMLPIRLWTARSMFVPHFSFSVLGALLRFGVPLVPTSLAYWVFLTSDRVVLERLSTLEQLGLYSVANSVINLTNIAINAFGQAWTPHAIRLYEEHRDTAAAAYGRVMTYLMAGFGLIAVGLTVFAPEILGVLTGPAYHSAASAVAPLAIALVAMASTQVTAGGITLAKKTAYLSIFAWVAAGANLALNLLLDGPFGMIGAAWATAVAYILLTLLYLVASQRLWAIAYEVRRTSAVIVLILGFTLLAGSLPSGSPVLVVLVKTLWCLAYVGGCVLLRAFDKRELDEIRGFLSRRRTDGAAEVTVRYDA
jgi:O-antigen/teichoic acid export membrane protein